ncbi:MAG: RluA family pseudouridine synthase, partial [Chloroflexi bacterium]|nr:RluA family pseudouridine synthase [Chloroflexota bacterium]
MTVAHIELVADRKDERLDQFTTRSCPELSRSFVQRLIRSGHATVNSVRVTKASQRLQPGDRVFLEVPPSTPLALEPEPIPLDILYEDEHILVLNKPAGLVTHPAPGHWDHTLVHGILAHCKNLPGIGGSVRPGIVHRLDKDTSGVLAVAKSDLGHRSLSRQIKDRRVVKKYLALVQGRVTPPEGEINAPIGRHPGNRKLMTIVPDGRHAVT